MFPKLVHIASSVVQSLTIVLDWFEEVNAYIHGHFGLLGQVAFNILLFYFVFLILSKIFKVTFDVVFYVALPSVILSFLSSFVLPYTFVTVLPFCLGLLIVVNIFRS